MGGDGHIFDIRYAAWIIHVNEQSERLIIDLSQGDRAQSYPKEQRLQRAAYDDVMVSLKRCTRQAQEFTRAKVSPDDGHLRDKIYRSRGEMMRIHNAIFVGGERGVGKTAFMLNIENVWKEEGGEKEKGSLHFTHPIDPTLIRVEDNFLNIIVSQIYKDVRPHVQRSPSQDFWNAFDELGAALEAEQAVSDNDLRGVDRILKHRDRADLEQKLNRFFEIACELLSVDAIVVLIDDVDMSLTKGFDILDTVRRYLSCPLIIPVISGDIALYESLVLKYFANELGVGGQLKDLDLASLRPIKEMDAGRSAGAVEDLSGLLRQAKILGQEYLKKVLPIHQRVVLKTIPDLSRQLYIYDQGWSGPVRFETLMANLAEGLSSPANGEDGSRPLIKLKTAREVIQFLEVIRDCIKPAPAEGDRAGVQFSRPGIFRKMAEYGRLTLDIEMEYRFNADVVFAERHDQPLQRLADIPYFNPRYHPQNLATYSLKDRFEELKVDGTGAKAPSQPSAGLPNAIMAMAVPEPVNANLIINLRDIEKYGQGDSGLLISIFTQRSYYTSYQRAALLLFGRAFEVIFSNCLGIYDESRLRNLINGQPFYTYLFFFPTRTIKIDERDPMEDSASDMILYEKDYRDFCNSIEEWYSKNREFLENKLTAIFLLKIMRRFFAQVNAYKMQKKIEQGTLADQINRFRIILLNACAILESRESRIVHQNIAMGSLAAYQKDSSWQINVAPLLRPEAEPSLTRILDEHPLFRLAGRAVSIPITAAYARPNPVRSNTKPRNQQTVDDRLKEELGEDLVNKLEAGRTDISAYDILGPLKRISDGMSTVQKNRLINSIKNARKIYTPIRRILNNEGVMDIFIDELTRK